MTDKRIISSARTGALFKKLASAESIELFTRFIIAALLPGANVFTDCTPFGAAFAASCRRGLPAAFGTAGAVLGYLLSGDILWSLKYIAAIFLIRAAMGIFRGLEFAESKWFPPLCTFTAFACTGFVYAAESGWAADTTVIFITETFLAGGAVVFYDIALSPWKAADGKSESNLCHSVSTVFLAATLLMALEGFYIFGILSIGRTAAVLVVMLTVFQGGIGIGTAGAAAIGAALDVAFGGIPFFTMAYSLSAIISGIFSKSGKLLFLLSYTVMNAICVIWTWEYLSLVSALYEVFAASVIFMLLPTAFMAKTSALFPARSPGYGFLRAREYTKERVALTGDAFRTLFETVRTATGDDTDRDNIAYVFDRAADAVCRGCSNAAECWGRLSGDTFDVFNNISKRLLASGSVSAEHFPTFFTDKCTKLSELISVINAETRTFLTRRQYRVRLQENRGAAYRQYGDIAAVLKSLSEELGKEINVEPSLERRLIKYLRSIDIDASAAVFRIKGGRLRAELRGSSLYLLRRDKDHLNKLSAVLGCRLCTPMTKRDSDAMILLEAEPLTVAASCAAARKSGKRVSGDKGLYFRTDEGLLCAVLSDGMGSGDEASAISSAAVDTLRKFLKAGTKPELALRILSDLMLLKGEADTESATVDLLCLDMFTGSAKIFKCGAAPSYLKRGGAVKRITSASFPLGPLSYGGVSASKFKLAPATFVVLISDGIIADNDDRWLKEMIVSYSGADPQELSGSILDAAAEKYGRSDDMTVLALRIDERR